MALDESRDFVTYEDIKMKFTDTLLLYKGKPVYIHADQARGYAVSAYYKPGAKGKATLVDIRDEDLDISSLSLGYVNFENTCYYTERSPLRRNKQGVSTENLAYHPLDPGKINGNMLFHSQGFWDMAENKYPSLDEALEKMDSGKAEAVAFSKHCCLRFADTSKIGLYYRKRLVGIQDLNDPKRFQLFESRDRSFLVREIRKEGLDV